jgi:hypothetical protein
MDAPYYNGEDDRDELTATTPECLFCGADADEPCEPFCECPYCRKVRARTDDPKEAA